MDLIYGEGWGRAVIDRFDQDDTAPLYINLTRHDLVYSYAGNVSHLAVFLVRSISTFTKHASCIDVSKTYWTTCRVIK